MNDEVTDLDQTDEEILTTCTVSDEALEAAAGTGGGKGDHLHNMTINTYTPCWPYAPC